jgi:drug/metabolite transporter (DMT)-like permease
MRPATIAGVLLLALGAFILFRGLSYTSDRSVLKVGEFQASVEERRSVPAWAGALIAVAGIALLVTGRRRV